MLYFKITKTTRKYEELGQIFTFSRGIYTKPLGSLLHNFIAETKQVIWFSMNLLLNKFTLRYLCEAIKIGLTVRAITCINERTISTLRLVARCGIDQRWARQG